MSFEMKEGGEAPGEFYTPDPHTDLRLGEEALLHLHATKDWADTLKHVSRLGRACVLTVHDLRVVSGGCIFPGSCNAWQRGCGGACPLGFQNTEQTAAEIRDAVADSAAVFITPSAFAAAFVREVYPDHGVHIIPNGVDVPKKPLAKRKAKEVMGIDPASKVLLFCAHGGVKAGPKAGDRWERIWQDIEGRVPGVSCYMVGGKSYERRGHLHILPYLEQGRLKKLMAAADVLAYPTFADNHPLVVLEAMSEGCVPVSFPVGGISEQIIHGVTGILREDACMEKLVESLVFLLQDDVFRRRASIKAHERAARYFHEHRMLEAHEKLYKRVIGISKEKAAAHQHTRSVDSAIARRSPH
jgi:glycosyltransferase involved in cell wall biosynthesis